MERLDAVGGRLDIASSAAGTTVCARVELEV
jgi:two-component system NarL family sensor kinase